LKAIEGRKKKKKKKNGRVFTVFLAGAWERLQRISRGRKKGGEFCF